MERDLTRIALFAALIAVLGLMPRLTLASGIPLTAQSMGIMLAGTILGARNGALAVLLFLGLVALGLPLLAGGRGGLGVFAGPTLGYLIGFPLGAFVTGLIASRFEHRMAFVPSLTGAFVGGIIVVTVCGIVGMAVMMGVSLAQATTFALPFLPGDVIKAVLTAGITAALWKARPALA
ncbi:biotin transporter BioY [Chachezhania antarctica]|uniref:biotin transporter BioY n=1 Tax=Chachezhania antarctica TaxID=2340860 RepID=UPI000EAD1D4E|nr:biotin transporter BioY [Chachezhania antarctica]|tara:strand:+ start:62 stop:595 length:534 start_codon:yes stop_codon:yes gene_type:complete